MVKRIPKKVSTKKSELKKLTIFDHIGNITSNKTDWEKYSESDVKSFEPYMVNRFLSMSYELIELVNLFQKYTVGFLSKREVFKLYSGFLPKQKYFLRYIKAKGEGTYNPELIDYLTKYFQCSKTEVIDYLNIYYKTENGVEEVIEILKKYGVEPKKISSIIKVKK